MKLGRSRLLLLSLSLLGLCGLSACGGGFDHAVANALAQGIVPMLDALGEYSNSVATTRYAGTTGGAAALLLGLPSDTAIEYEVSNTGQGGFNVTYATGETFRSLASGAYQPSDESASQATFTVPYPIFTVNLADGSVTYPAGQTERSLTVRTEVVDGEWTWTWPRETLAFGGTGTIPAGTAVSWHKVATERTTR